MGSRNRRNQPGRGGREGQAVLVWQMGLMSQHETSAVPVSVMYTCCKMEAHPGQEHWGDLDTRWQPSTEVLLEVGLFSPPVFPRINLRIWGELSCGIRLLSLTVNSERIVCEQTFDVIQMGELTEWLYPLVSGWFGTKIPGPIHTCYHIIVFILIPQRGVQEVGTFWVWWPDPPNCGILVKCHPYPAGLSLPHLQNGLSKSETPLVKIFALSIPTAI